MKWLILTTLAAAGLTAHARGDSWTIHRSATWTASSPASHEVHAQSAYEFHARRSKAEADIESLKGRAYLTQEGWDVHVSFDVEIEDAHRDERFDLVFRIRAKDGHGGPPMQAVVPLDHPTDVDDDELEFEGRTVLRLPHDIVYPGEKLRIDAYVYVRGSNRPLDHEDTTVKTK